MTAPAPRTELQARIAELLRAHLPHKGIARELGCGLRTIIRVAAKLEIRPKRERSERIRDALAAGAGATAIARSEGCSLDVVRAVRRRARQSCHA